MVTLAWFCVMILAGAWIVMFTVLTTCAVALLMWIVAATVRYALGTGPRV